MISPIVRIVPLFSLILITAVVSKGQEKRINVNAPFDSISYSQEGSVLSIRVKLREVPVNDKESVSTPQRLFTITSLSATGQNTGVVSQNPQNDDPLTFVFPVQILSNEKDPELLGTTFRLKPSWEKFSFVIDYQFAMEAVDPSSSAPKPRQLKSTNFSIVRSLLAQQEETPVVTLPLLWAVDQSGATAYLGVRIEANDLRVQIDLKDDNLGGIVVASGRQLLRQGISEVIDLKLVDGLNVVKGHDYTIEITSLRAGTTIAKSAQKTSVKSLQPQDIYAFEKTAANNQALSNLRSDSTNRPLEFQLSTTASGSLKLMFDGVQRDPTASNNGTDHRFSVSLQGLDDGRYPVHFEGEASSSGQKFTDKSKQYFITVDSKTRVEGETALSLDGNNNLVIRYSLNREVTQSSVEFPDLKFSVKSEPISGIKNRWEATVNLNAASDLVKNLQKELQKPENAQKAQVPTTFTIVSISPDRGQEKSASFSLAAVRVNQAALVEALNKKNLTEPQAKSEAQKALGLTSTTTGSSEDQAINYLASILREKSDKKSRFTSFLKFAGKVAAGYFGIPVPL